MIVGKREREVDLWANKKRETSVRVDYKERGREGERERERECVCVCCLKEDDGLGFFFFFFFFPMMGRGHPIGQQ